MPNKGVPSYLIMDSDIPDIWTITGDKALLPAECAVGSFNLKFECVS